MSTEALASIYTGRLHGSQIRLLRLISTSTCGKCDHLHLDEDDSDFDEDDCKSNISDLSSVSADSDDRVHDACRGHGCVDCDRIRCELIVVPMEDVASKFAALSYVWGYPYRGKTIKVNGTDVPVTMNLEAALRRIRNTEKVELLWVDAICINQTDIEEKNVQVMRMKEIYAKSMRVLIWVGDALHDQDDDDGRQHVQDAETSISIFKDIHRIAQGRRLVAKPDAYGLFVYSAFPFDDPTTLGLPSADSTDWESVNSFLSRPWFSRVWIIQEVACASEALMLVGKEARIGWKQTAAAVIWLHRHAYLDNIPGLHNCWNVLIIDTCRKHSIVPLMLRLTTTAAFCSSLPHDKIFALLGMTTEGQALEKYPQLRVDYGRDWGELSRDVVRHCIETPGSFGTKRTLHVLSQVRHTCDEGEDFRWDTEQSSWVPAWNDDSQNRPISWVPGWNDDNQHCPIAWRSVSSHFTTAKDTEATIIDSGDSRILSLRGVIVDKVAKTYTHLIDIDIYEVDSPFWSLHVFRAVSNLWASVLMNWRMYVPNWYPHLGDAFAKVLAAGSVTRHGTSEASPGMYFYAYSKTGLLLADAEGSKFQFSYLLTPPDICVRVWDHTHETEEEKREEYLVHMANNFKMAIELGKIVFVTEKGYLGLGPSIMTPGDEVCVLYGGTTPFVVQRVKKGVNCPEWLLVNDEERTFYSLGKLMSAMKSFLGNLMLAMKSFLSFGTRYPIRPNDERAQPPSTATPSSPPRMDAYRLVGECYVEGLMDGEALDQRDAGKLSEKTLHLV